MWPKQSFLESYIHATEKTTQRLLWYKDEVYWVTTQPSEDNNWEHQLRHNKKTEWNQWEVESM